MSEHDDERTAQDAGGPVREPWGPLARRRAREEAGS
jgi:hypothetical protein